MIKLKEETLALIKTDKALFVKVQASLGVSEKTMYDYINKKSESLTKLSALNEIVMHTGSPLSKLIVGSKVSKLLCK